MFSYDFWKVSTYKKTIRNSVHSKGIRGSQKNTDLQTQHLRYMCNKTGVTLFNYVRFKIGKQVEYLQRNSSFLKTVTD
jgi:hypothetical protein